MSNKRNETQAHGLSKNHTRKVIKRTRRLYIRYVLAVLILILNLHYFFQIIDTLFFLLNENGFDEEESIVFNRIMKDELSSPNASLSTLSSTLSSTSTSFTNLRAIITGLGYSSTYMVGKLIMNAPCVIGAFETGYLLANTPSEIQFIPSWLTWNSIRHKMDPMLYSLQPDDISLMKNASNFVEMYDIIRNKSHLFNDIVDEEYCPRPYQMVDSTPSYIYPEYFEDIVAKTPNVPVIVVVKTFDKVEKSYASHNNMLTRQFYDEVYRNVDIVKQKYPTRILMVQYEDLLNKPHSIMTTIFKFVGLEWKNEYLNMTGLKKKFQHYPDVLAALNSHELKDGKDEPSRTKHDLEYDEQFHNLRMKSIESRIVTDYKLYQSIQSKHGHPTSIAFSTSGNVKIEGARTIVIYSGPTSLDTNKGKNWMYIKNFEYFLDHGIDCNKHSTVIIVTEPVVEAYDSRIKEMNRYKCHDSKFSIELKKREDKCYDMESMNTFLQEVDTSLYDYFVYVNCGMVGPKTTGGVYWTNLFTSRLSDTLKMVGVSINMWNHPHVQSMAYALDRTGIEIIKNSNAIYDCNIYNDNINFDAFWDIVMNYEVGMSKAILQAGYSIGSMVGVFGGMTISMDNINAVIIESRTLFDQSPVQPSLNNSIWDSNSFRIIRSWGNDIWNEAAFRIMGKNGTLPLWSDFIFFKASRLILLPDIASEINYDHPSVTILRDARIWRDKDRDIYVCDNARSNFREASKLFVIVTGIKHTGSSIVANLIKSDPSLAGGFQCGLLYNGTKPIDFRNAHPFYEMSMYDLELDYWGLNTESRDKIVNAKCDAEMYATLHDYSPIFHQGINKKSYLVDHTPEYLHDLVQVMDRTPGIPVIITMKTDEDIMSSWTKRGAKPKFIEAEIKKNKMNIAHAMKKYPNRIHVVNTTKWIEYPNEVMNHTFDFLGLEWHEEYLNMRVFNGKKLPGSVMSEAFNVTRGYFKGISTLSTASQ